MGRELATLPVEQRAQQALVTMGAPTIEALIAKMETFKPVSEAEITDKDTFTPAWESLKEVRETRKEIETTGKEARADATAYSKAVIAAEKTLLEVIAPVESILKEKTDAWKKQEEERKAAKREAEAREAKRVAGIGALIAEITAIPGAFLNAVSFEIAGAYEELESRDLESEGSFGEFIEKAKEEKAKSLDALKTAIDRAANQEQQARQLAEMQAQQAEFERQKAEFAEMQRQAELSAKSAENARFQAEKDKAEAEAKTLREADAKRQQEESARIAAEAKAQADKEEADRQAALAPDKDKLMKYAADLLEFAGTNVPALQSKEANELFTAVVVSINKIAAQIQNRASAL